ncbi:hypothetical protein KS4_35680 [Poriferisphaera corsica]|uniref:Helix-turn-helix domain-containing protein n=1 Tax=Poriferisphaera corsica TaxID=2528020 RepID=A0A517YZ32_9BACT|nr:hypothetical protein [Poriferisphaera corsica]QDU35485.1 hypothetical protein KS4_35680 [Poriferisphaera corsica]
MLSKWLSVEEAATALGVSATTVRRRISANAVEWQQNEGRREVKVYFEQGTEDQPGMGLVLERNGAPIEQHDTPRMKAAHKQPQDLQEPIELEPARPNAQVLGGQNYSPLPSDEVGTPDEDEDWNEISENQTEAERWPMGKPGFLKPSHLLNDQEEKDDLSPEAQARRFQKLAGASVLLAQRQADEANEKIAILHNHTYRMRQMCYLAWSAAAVIALASIGTVAFTSSSAPAAAVAAPASTTAVPTEMQTDYSEFAEAAMEDTSFLDNQNHEFAGMPIQEITAQTTLEELTQIEQKSQQPNKLQNENDSLRKQLKSMKSQLQKMEQKSDRARRALQDALNEEAMLH